MDILVEPSGKDELARLGIPRVPATVIGDRFVHGWNPKALAELVGIQWDGGARLEPEELARRLDRILAANQRVLRQIPRAHLGMQYPGRPRSVLDLGFHVFRVAAAFPDCREQGTFDPGWFSENCPPGITDGEACARHGQAVRDRLAAFVARPGWCDGEVNTYYGVHPAPDLMERTTWHAAQHLRQMYWFLEQMGIPAEQPLDPADYQGLPIPREVWS